MSSRTYQCTRCGETFTYNSDRDALFCPICGSTARYVTKPTTTVTNNFTNSQYYNVTFTDPDSKVKIATATIPDGWQYGASIKGYNQSLMVQYLGVCQAQKADGSAVMFVKTGDNFLDVRNGINPNETHQDGEMNQYFNIPMLRLDSTENYINSIAPEYVTKAKLTAKAVSKLPSYYAQNAKVFQQEMAKEVTEFSSYFKNNNNITFEAGAPVTESKLVQYSYTINKTKYVMLLGTDLGAYEFRLTGPSANNNVVSLLTTLVTGQNNNANVGQYIHWGSKLIFGLITTEDNYNNVSNQFLNFVSSFKMDPSYKTNGKKVNTTTSGKRKTTSSNQTTTGTNGFSLTDILTGLLSAAGGSNAEDSSNNLSFDWTSLFKE